MSSPQTPNLHTRCHLVSNSHPPEVLCCLGAEGSDNSQTNDFQMVVLWDTGCFVLQQKAIVEGHYEVARRKASWTKPGLTPGRSISFWLLLCSDSDRLRNRAHEADSWGSWSGPMRIRNLKDNYVLDRLQLECQEGSCYWSVSSVGGPGLWRLRRPTGLRCIA